MTYSLEVEEHTERKFRILITNIMIKFMDSLAGVKCNHGYIIPFPLPS